MTSHEILNRRLHNQHLSSPRLKRPEELVKWFGAVQAQDYNGAKWALAQRLRNGVDKVIEDSFTEGSILRTHVLRPTWHFVTPKDIRWMLSLTSQRIHRASASYYRKLELDSAIFRRSRKVLINALRGGHYQTRKSLASALARAGIEATSLRLSFLLLNAELDAVICSGPRRGKQFTYALFDERVPITQPLTRDEGLADLTQRYFASHGPATVQDFAWWSGLTSSDAKNGLEMNGHCLVKEIINGETYWMQPSGPQKGASEVVRLLPNYDEYLVAYKDRRAALPLEQMATRNPIFNCPIVVNGKVVGEWKRQLSKATVIVTLHPFTKWSGSEKRLVTQAAQHYGRFLGMKTVLA